MAVTPTVVWAGPDSYIADINWAADADTDSANIPHGLGAVPDEMYLSLYGAQGALPSNVYIKSCDATNVVVSKTNVTATVAPANARLVLKRPNTIGR